MASTSHSSQQHRHDHHDWASPDYVAKWAEGQDPKEKNRQEPFRVMAKQVQNDLGAGMLYAAGKRATLILAYFSTLG